MAVHFVLFYQLSAPAPNVVIEENEEVRPQRRKLGQCLKEGAHFRCLLLTLIQASDFERDTFSPENCANASQLILSIH